MKATHIALLGSLVIALASSACSGSPAESIEVQDVTGATIAREGGPRTTHRITVRAGSSTNDCDQELQRIGIKTVSILGSILDVEVPLDKTAKRAESLTCVSAIERNGSDSPLLPGVLAKLEPSVAAGLENVVLHDNEMGIWGSYIVTLRAHDDLPALQARIASYPTDVYARNRAHATLDGKLIVNTCIRLAELYRDLAELDEVTLIENVHEKHTRVMAPVVKMGTAIEAAVAAPPPTGVRFPFGILLGFETIESYDAGLPKLRALASTPGSDFTITSELRLPDLGMGMIFVNTTYASLQQVLPMPEVWNIEKDYEAGPR